MKQNIESYGDYATKVPERGWFSTPLILNGKRAQSRRVLFVTEYVGSLKMTLMDHGTDDVCD